ncbi:MAG: hypothetical protein FD138_1948 [Planctomycetota bacterium]|nr:MAG: hypothetical protein FD138_1948 [Planctomycetota bacterium]
MEDTRETVEPNYDKSVNGFARVFNGKSTGPPTRCDSKMAAIISIIDRESAAEHLVWRSFSMQSIKSVIAAMWPPS